MPSPPVKINISFFVTSESGVVAIETEFINLVKLQIQMLRGKQ